MSQYICKKCNILYNEDIECKECQIRVFKIPNCYNCQNKIDNYPLQTDIDSQFCDFCKISLCINCSKKLNCTFYRCSDCGVSHCFWINTQDGGEYCYLIPIGKFGTHEECDCYH